MPGEAIFSGSRLVLARHFRGREAADLAESLGVKRQYIHQIETNARRPTPEMWDAIAETMAFHRTFFALELPADYGPSVGHFRTFKSATKRELEQVRAQGKVFELLVRHVESAVKLPRPIVPRFEATSTEDAERAAEHCRLAWGLPLTAPIGHLSRVLEHAGVAIGSFISSRSKISAFSWYGMNRPFAVRNHFMPPSRNRFSLAHELGHLVMHTSADWGCSDVLEEQADRFASAFLMPAAGFSLEYPQGAWLDWQELFRLKSRWGASVQAVVRRARDLGLLPAVLYQRACRHVGASGWRKNEPGEPSSAELPEVISAATALVARKKGKTLSGFAAELGVFPEVLTQLGCRFESAPGPKQPSPERTPTVIQFPTVRRNS